MYSLGENVEHSGFKHKHIEDWVDRVYGLWKIEGK